jgi:hypothetical protein
VLRAVGFVNVVASWPLPSQQQAFRWVPCVLARPESRGESIGFPPINDAWRILLQALCLLRRVTVIVAVSIEISPSCSDRTLSCDCQASD